MLFKPKFNNSIFLLVSFFLFNFALLNPLFAQQGEGFDELENKDFENAKTIFEKKIQSKKTKFIGEVGMAMLLAHEENENQDLSLAYGYIANSSTNYNKLKDKKKQEYKSKNGITYKVLKDAKKKIFEQISIHAKDNADLDLCQSMLEQKLAYKEKKTIMNIRNEIIYENAKKENTLAAYDPIVNIYYKDFKKYSRKYLRRAETQIFLFDIKENGWDNLKAFKKANPKNSIVKDPSLKKFIAIKDKNDNQLFQKFITENPKSYFRRMATDSICIDKYYSLKDSKNIADQIDFINNYKLSRFADSMENNLITYVENKRSLRNYKSMIRRYPAIIQSNKFMDNLYELSTEDSTLTSIESFVLKYPKFHNQSRIQKDKEIFRLRDIEESKKPYEQRMAEERKRNIIKYAKDDPNKAFSKLQELVKDDVDAKKWDAVKLTVDKYEAYLGENKLYKDFVEILNRPDGGIEAKYLNDGVNSTGMEYLPIISSDGKTLYFGAQHRKTSKGGEDIFYSKKVNGEWQPAKIITDINSYGNEAPLSISADGNRLVVFNNGELAYSEKTSTGWSEIIPFNSNINSNSWQCDAMVTSDGKHLLLATGDWNVDIMVSEKQEDGTWGKLKSIGNTINTDKNDRSPFLHPDMKTLYFCSNGHGGLGDFDVFKSTRLDDTWTNWSDPVNLGKEINTSAKEWGYQISTDGTTAYFSTQGKGKDDIFEVALPESMRPEPVQAISGNILGLTKNQSANVIVKNAETGENIAEATTDPETGKYYVVIPEGIKPLISIVKEDVYSSPQEIVMSGKGGEITQDIRVVDFSKEEDLSLAFTDLLFDTDQSIIKPDFMDDLNRLSEIVKRNKHQVTIEGHTDNAGGDDHNMKLSQARAEAVKTYLTNMGCDPNNIIATGLGETQPIASNDTEAGMKINRRVKINFKKL